MKCDNCADSEATIHQIHVTDNNEIKHLQLCEACAKEQSSESPEAEAGVAEAFSGLESDGEDSDVCPECGTSLMELKNRNKVGCEQCYRTFRDQLEVLVHRIHGADQHVGTAPETSGSDEPSSGLGKVSPGKKKRMLEKRLQQRVEEEDYESAAELRDRIETLEEEQDDGITG